MKRRIWTFTLVLAILATTAGLALAGSSPTVSTGAASTIKDTSASLNGTVNPQGTSTSYVFEYGLTTSYGLVTKRKSAGAGSKDAKASAPVSGLVPGTVYHYRLFATNKFGTGQGTDHTFKTSGHPPAAVTTGPATAIGKTSVTLTGSVNPNGQATTWTFQYGLTTSYQSQTVPSLLLASSTPTTVTSTLSGIQPGVTFHYRLVALHGTSVISAGADQTFFTLPNPTPVPKVKARTSPGTDKHKPFVFTTKGSIAGPSSIPSSLACAGDAEIGYYLGNIRVSFALVPVQSNCTFSGSASFAHLPHVGKHGPNTVTLNVKVHYQGTGYLKAASATTEKVKLG